MAMTKILVVDDSQTSRLLLSKMVERLPIGDLKVLEAGSGTQALELVKTHHPDVVISDVRMPEMSGVDLARRLQQHEPRVPVILVSSTSLEASREGELSAGAVTFLRKPVSVESLSRALVEAAGVGSRFSRSPLFANPTEIVEGMRDGLLDLGTVYPALALTPGAVLDALKGSVLAGSSLAVRHGTDRRELGIATSWTSVETLARKLLDLTPLHKLSVERVKDAQGEVLNLAIARIVNEWEAALRESGGDAPGLKVESSPRFLGGRVCVDALAKAEARLVQDFQGEGFSLTIAFFVGGGM
jgi:CheY-like chemotaxis protein